MLITALIYFVTGTLFGAVTIYFIINKRIIAEVHEEIAQELEKELQEILGRYLDALELKEKKNNE